MRSDEFKKIQLIFSELCAKIFDAKKLLKRQKVEVNHEEIHSSLKTLIKQAKSISSDQEIPYLFAALTDEIFLNIEWEGKKFWEENILEQIFFETQTAGETIFVRIDDLLAAKSPEMADKAQIYLKILALGFLGKYRGLEHEQKKIKEIKQKLYDFIEHFDKSIFLMESRLFQTAYNHTMPTINRQLLPDANSILYICSGLIFLFLVIGTIIWIVELREFTGLLDEITALALRVKK